LEQGDWPDGGRPPRIRHWTRTDLSADTWQHPAVPTIWEFPLAYWLEKEGYDVSYISNVDTHADAKGLLRAKSWLSVGHDEYWSLDMYKNVKAAFDAGVHGAFFSGNAVDGVVAMLPNSVGAPHRAISRVGK